MNSKTFMVPNISCDHCSHTIKMELTDLQGVQSVDADSATKQVTIQWDEPTDWPEIESLLQEINYPPA